MDILKIATYFPLWTLTVILVYLGSLEVTANVCYFGQEPDPNEEGKLRWVMPCMDGCLCTSIKPGAVNMQTLPRHCRSFYTDHPLFTDDRQEIHDFFECYDDGAVRLVEGPSPNVGRVEVYYKGEWGTVCDDYWDMDDGNVVCRQLGYPSALQIWPRAHYGMGTGPIYLDDAMCTGNETSLWICSHRGWGIHNCIHGEDAGVACDLN